jgi:hypothetical protein
MNPTPIRSADANQAATPDRKPPERVYVNCDSGQPYELSLFDADTHEAIQGVFRIELDREQMTLIVSPHWPIAREDHALLKPPDTEEEWEVFNGLRVVRWYFPIKSIEVSSW